MQKCIIIWLLKVWVPFMKREGLLPCSEKYAFRPCPIQTCPNRPTPNLMSSVMLYPHPPFHSFTECCNAICFLCAVTYFLRLTVFYAQVCSLTSFYA